jgi:hypothetical protein
MDSMILWINESSTIADDMKSAAILGDSHG